MEQFVRLHDGLIDRLLIASKNGLDWSDVYRTKFDLMFNWRSLIRIMIHLYINWTVLI